MNRIVIPSSLVLLLVLFLFACIGTSEINVEDSREEQEPIYEEDEESTIRVFTIGDVTHFMDVFGNDIRKQFKHINLEVFTKTIFTKSDTKKELEHFFAENNIDIIFTPEYYEDWSKEGLLLALDVYLEDREFEVEKIHPGLLDLLRAENGRIYGLAPMFTSFALYYNKDIFDHYEVAYPHDHMSWEDVFTLAAQFPVGEVTGLYDLFNTNIISYVANANSISLFDEGGTQVNIANNEEFREMMESIIVGMQKGSIITSFEDDLFLEKEAAMTYSYYYYSILLEDRNISFAWDVAREPRHPSRANQSYSMHPGHTMSIIAESKHADQAWEIIKFLNSEEYTAKLIEEDPRYLVSRTAHIRSTPDKNMRVFYDSTRSDTKTYLSSPIVRNFNTEFSGVVLEVFPRMVSESLTIEEGLEAMQILTQKIVDELLEDVE